MLNDYMTLEEFNNYYQEFKTIADPVKQFYLDTAEPQINKKVFLKQTKMAHGLWAAHLLSSSPFGRNLKLQTPDGLTDYSAAYNMIVAAISPSMTVCNAGGFYGC